MRTKFYRIKPPSPLPLPVLYFPFQLVSSCLTICSIIDSPIQGNVEAAGRRETTRRRAQLLREEKKGKKKTHTKKERKPTENKERERETARDR
jgi:hypothetical protein